MVLLMWMGGTITTTTCQHDNMYMHMCMYMCMCMYVYMHMYGR
jgi:hypothetical protein